ARLLLASFPPLFPYTTLFRSFLQAFPPWILTSHRHRKGLPTRGRLRQRIVPISGESRGHHEVTRVNLHGPYWSINRVVFPGRCSGSFPAQKLRPIQGLWRHASS